MQFVHIQLLQTVAEAKACAEMMAQSQPWVTLGRDFNASYTTISDTSQEVYLALRSEQIAGFVIINLHGAFTGYIQSICVASDWRGQGIGTELLTFAEQRIFRQTPNVFICVSSFNPQAQQLYERLSYSVIGELRDYIITGASEILLRKTIGPLSLLCYFHILSGR